MRGNYISGPAAVLVILFFFLPWVTVSCNGQPLGEFSGYDLAAGVPVSTLVGSEALSPLGGLPGDPALFLVPLVALITLLWVILAFVKKEWEVYTGAGTVAAAVLGVLVLVWRWLVIPAQPLELVAISYEPAMWLTLVGLVGIILGGGVSIVLSRRETAVPFIPGTPPFPPQPYSARSGNGRPSAQPTILDNPAPASPSERGTRPLEPAAQSAVEVAPAPQTVMGDTSTTTDEPYTAVDKTEILSDQPTVLAWLIIREGEQAGSQFRLFGVTQIGRHPSNDIVLTDPSVSGRHARVVWEDGRFILYDLQSTNGVYLKDDATYSWQRISTVDLADSVQVRLGRVVLHMMVVAAE
ncbi:MAG: FHA domain-containing protein [Chloroflexi bacterium]|nr:FHA domain-containing protein [Chloroflexota bacterium]MBP7044498.1 FHA domain-containing protein [Chloroflexota bacterium]